MTDPATHSYFEAYETAQGLAVEVYLTPEDLRLAQHDRITLTPNPIDDAHLGIARIHVSHTTKPRHRQPTPPDTQT